VARKVMSRKLSCSIVLDQYMVGETMRLWFAGAFLSSKYVLYLVIIINVINYM
jgi:hypothetical protein